MKLTHYAKQPFTGPVVSCSQKQEPRPHGKPVGFWVSVDAGGDGWADFCRDEYLVPERLTHVHEVTLVASNTVLLIDSLQRFDDFHAEFSARCPHVYPWDAVDWQRVASLRAGLIIAPYFRERRFSPMWYYGWDCASGCIWDASAIASVTLREVQPLVEALDTAET